MKKERVKQFNIGTQQGDSISKPFGFCCNLKDANPRLFLQKGNMNRLFPSSNELNVGPDIKVRIQANDSLSTSHRSGLRGGQRGGSRGRHRIGQAFSWSDQARNRQRGGPGAYGGHARSKLSAPILPSGEPMKCKRCRGPLKWFLEEEINVAFALMMNERQQKYKAEMEQNIAMARKKEQTKKKGKKKLSEVKENSDDNPAKGDEENE